MAQLKQGNKIILDSKPISELRDVLRSGMCPGGYIQYNKDEMKAHEPQNMSKARSLKMLIQ